MDRRGQKLPSIERLDVLPILVIFVVVVVYVVAPFTLMVGLFGMSKDWGAFVAKLGGGVSLVGWLVALIVILVSLKNDPSSSPELDGD